jgi:hypothetical protein
MEEFRYDAVAFSTTHRVLKLRRATWFNVPLNQHNLLFLYPVLMPIQKKSNGDKCTIRRT